MRSAHAEIFYPGTCLPSAPLSRLPEINQRTPLHFACEAGSPECVKELLKASASPNVSDEDARTPLHFGEEAELYFVFWAIYANRMVPHQWLLVTAVLLVVAVEVVMVRVIFPG